MHSGPVFFNHFPAFLHPPLPKPLPVLLYFLVSRLVFKITQKDLEGIRIPDFSCHLEVWGYVWVSSQCVCVTFFSFLFGSQRVNEIQAFH